MSKSKILIVEDESIIAEDLADSLTIMGYTVMDIVSSAEEAIVIAVEKQPNLILMDVMLQGKMDGITAAEQIHLSSQIPIIFLTAYTDDKTLQRVKATNPFGYIVKPFEERNLHLTIEIALQRYQYDPITQLPNRSLFTDQLNEIISYQNHSNLGKLCHLNKSQKNTYFPIIPILYISLDRINRIKVTLGSKNGDLVLCSVAKKLNKSIDSIDMLAHLEAAEFGIILKAVEKKQEVTDIVQSILDTISQPIVLEGYEIYLTASIGITFYPLDDIEANELLKNANAAMYYAQQKGGNNYQFHQSETVFVSLEQLSLETDLRNALKRSEFQVYYQPKVNIKTGKITGAEALVRWSHPNRGLVSPAEFIPLAEETGLIIPIGEWVLRTACNQTRIWQEVGFGLLEIAVNVSRCQFTQRNIQEKIIKIIQETGIKPNYLELEITESLVMQNEKAATQIMEAWQTFGINISMDDFGTGYSSLSYLREFPFDVIKIDRCFIRNITEDSKTEAITIAIIQMAHNLNLKVVAEGVETQSELDFLRKYDCDEIQGYLFSPPLPTSKFENLLKTNQLSQFPSI
ncbi:bifunctional diguanylate cyclase/phosphodiesterase [Okeania sp. SIO2B3]|uniref:putative bifunctional diguanylate cyclase/phosphodiesterase n=1 Tax=Okeania sp. SIO2B3 TaxID=2607784 RepID=UPI0013C05339|nr:GGDEF domain-containing phosphodiesterase [Okeania sp. SIO2B3]NET46300.1 EAL domain-containing protein [Okeania sp. SIO2B3]